jgi:4a-hydroxytetrahydrobiopterin dehydratase
MTEQRAFKELRSLPGWKYLAASKSICTEIRCKDFMAAIRLIRKIAKLAERADHHPDLHLTRYRRLKVVLTTHDAGGVTAKDLTLAKSISKL